MEPFVKYTPPRYKEGASHFYSKIGVISFLLAGLYVPFMYYDVLSIIFGDRPCRGGWWCWGYFFEYLTIAFIILPLVVAGVGYYFAKERRWRKSLASLVIALVSMFIAVQVLFYLNRLHEDVAVQRAEEGRIEFMELVDQSERVVTEAVRGEVLSRPDVDWNRKATARGVLQAKTAPTRFSPDMPTEVVFSAEIGSAKDVQSVRLYRVSDKWVLPEQNESTEFVAMRDDGLGGDVYANDTVFTVTKTVLPVTEQQIKYKINVVYENGYEATSHQTLVLDVAQ